ncbi:MAG: hypothetical protein OXN95_00190 [bacterium]|nr:hypothetical protein [bacterium]
METTHVEVTYEGVLVAVDGDAERKLTSEEFSLAFEQMAERLYEIDGLVDPSLWGQASNGQVELAFCLPRFGNTKKMTADAISIIAEVGAAGGIEIEGCGGITPNGGEIATLGATRAAKSASGCPRLVLHGTHRTAEVQPSS